MSVTEPATISHYRLIEMIGRGAMGEVWLAEDTQLPRQVAVKLLPRHLAGDADAVERLQREAQMAASVDHPSVVTVYEAGIEDGQPYLVMQRVEGETLEKRFERGVLGLEEAINLATAIADALAEVHALGIVHRDLKPANIMLSNHGPRILDFGVASVKGSAKMTATGSTIGTPYAMSPEQIRGAHADNRSDLWSLGVILYQALTGKRPFDGPSLEAVAYQVLNVQPAAPATLRPEIGGDLDHAIMKLLRKNPAHRYARAEDVIADLDSCCAEVRAPSATGAGEPAAAPAIPRVAVMYFDVMSPDPDDAYLAAGLADDLIVDLTRVEGVRVASRADVLPFRDRSVPPRTLARELDVEYVLLGSVRRAGKRARISAQLVRASDGHALWAERFDRTLEDLFDVQAEVSKRIVDALQIALMPREREMLTRTPSKSPQAYTLYLRAREILDRGRDDNRRAEAMLTEALDLDPDFALGHAALAECFAWRGMRWWSNLETAARRAMPQAKRALELDPGLFEGHFAMGMVHRLQGAKDELMKSLEKIRLMNPEHAMAMEWSAWAYMSMGDFETTRAVLEPVVRRHPGRFVALSYLATVLEALGDTNEAERLRQVTREKLVEHIRRQPDDALARTFLAIELVRVGELERGIEQLDRALAIDPDDNRVRYNVACAFARAGMRDRAIEELKRAITGMEGFNTDWPRRDPDLASLRDHPEFDKLLPPEGARP